MNTAFIIAEYNPFHNGHLYHIEQTRKALSPDYVAAVMSGNFVQRGDIAICDKYLRAEAAVRCGADLVVELPVKYAVSNASRFARGAVETICFFGVEGTVSFGASASLAELEKASQALSDTDVLSRIKELSRRAGKTFPAAFDAVLRSGGQEDIAVLFKDPNNILAIEYLRNIQNTDSLQAFAVRREEAYAHDSSAPSDHFASAACLREMIYKSYNDNMELYKLNNIIDFVPKPTIDLLNNAFSDGVFPVDRNKYDTAAYSRLLNMTANDFRKIDNVNQGLENRITEAIKNNSSPFDAICDIKSKRHTMARLRQIITAAVLGVTKEDVVSSPSYIRVLAFNEKGRELLGHLRETALLPIAANLSDVGSLDNCKRDVALEYSADKLFDLCLPRPRGGNRPYRAHAVYVKNNAGD